MKSGIMSADPEQICQHFKMFFILFRLVALDD